MGRRNLPAAVHVNAHVALLVSDVDFRTPHVHSLDPTLGESFRAVIRKMDGHLVHVPDEVKIAMGSTTTWTSPHHEFEGGVIVLLVVEDRRRLVHDVGHRHGDPLLSPSKIPLQELNLDAVELPLGPLAYGLALAKGSLELGALLVPPDKG